MSGWTTSVREQWVAASWSAEFAQAFTTTCSGGVSKGAYAGFNLAAHVGDSKAAVARNRDMLGQRLGVQSVQWLNQVHGTVCLRSDLTTTPAPLEADAAWTEQPGVVLAVLTADCLPVVFCRRHGGAIAIAHAGWRGLVAGVLRNVLHALPGECSDYLAWIGPAIGVDAYQVGEEVADGVREMDDAGVRPDRYLSPNNAQTGKYQLDLAGLATQQLFYLGVAEVSCERICSYGDRRFYSYRREGITGRMATVVWLADAEAPLR